MARSKYEKIAHKQLEKMGYKVDYKIRPSGFKNPSSYTVDYFGIFDLVVHRVGEPLRWISIKGKAGVPSKHRKEIEDFWMPDNNSKEIWTYSKGPRHEPRREVIT